ncbi:MAG: arsenite methyltransferase [Coriobacteriia bacterium]|nr:arsenite methyltransferase [Coriobacteriia bacterium]
MDDVKRAVRERYAARARANAPERQECASPACCDSGGAGCQAGYSPAELAEVPIGAGLGLGCGDPTAVAALREGETVVDLGSGGGIDCFIAARRVGPAGSVIGVDMTAEMIDLARRNAREGGYGNVEFRLGELEALPVADSVADVVISNCVVNLVPDKPQAFREAFRALKPGGRLEVSDIVTLGEPPQALRDSVDAYAGCLAGASPKEGYLADIAAAGFEDVRVTEERPFADEDDSTLAMLVDDLGLAGRLSPEQARNAAGLFASVHVSARKPVG